MSTTFVGGKLKLKGGVDPTQLKGGVKKKKKKKDKRKEEEEALAVVPADGGAEGATEAAAAGEGGDQQQQVGVPAEQNGPPGWGAARAWMQPVPCRARTRMLFQGACLGNDLGVPRPVPLPPHPTPPIPTHPPIPTTTSMRRAAPPPPPRHHQDAPGGSKLPPGAVKVTREGVVLDPSAVEDRRTEAEKRADAHFLKYEEQRARKAAAKSHRWGPPSRTEQRLGQGRQAEPSWPSLLAAPRLHTASKLQVLVRARWQASCCCELPSLSLC